jgi:hypothetical protein
VFTRALANGPDSFRRNLGAVSALDYETRPYDDQVLGLAQAAKKERRRVYITSAPKLLWLICPIFPYCLIFPYWIRRELIMANHRIMTDDPVVFALKDRASILAVASIIIIVVIAAI